MVDLYIIPKEYQNLIQFSTTEVTDRNTTTLNPIVHQINQEHCYDKFSALQQASQTHILPQAILRFEDRERVPTNIRMKNAPDGVFNYASAVLNDGMLYLRCCIREGDGTRVLQCWKSLMLYFDSAK